MPSQALKKKIEVGCSFFGFTMHRPINSLANALLIGLGVLPLLAQETQSQPSQDGVAKVAPELKAGSRKNTDFDFSQMRITFQPTIPPYPFWGKIRHEQGTVVVEMTVDPTGNPSKAKALTGQPEIRNHAEKYAMNWRFAPALLNGVPMTARFRLTMPYHLKGKVMFKSAKLEMLTEPTWTPEERAKLEATAKEELSKLGVALVTSSSATPNAVRDIRIQIVPAAGQDHDLLISLQCTVPIAGNDPTAKAIAPYSTSEIAKEEFSTAQIAVRNVLWRLIDAPGD